MSDEGTMRYGQIYQSVLGITNTMLAKSLTQMAEDGLINRVQYNEMPLRVEYSLTKKANSFLPILLELKAWGEKNLR